MSKTSSGLFSGTIGSRITPWRINHLHPSTSLPKKSHSAAPIKDIPADKIRFSQTSVNGSQEIIDSMRKNGWVGDPVDVVTMPDGNLTTIDNTRVVAAQIVGIKVKARVHAYDEHIDDPKTARRLSTKRGGIPNTWGEAATYRIAKQNRTFRNKYPMGSYTMDRIN